MSLAAKYSGHRYGSAAAPNTVELYLDYVCPYSKKMYDAVDKVVLPLIDKDQGKIVSIIFRNQVQSWHPSSTHVHEASLAVEKIDPAKFFPFSKALFARQTEFFDTAVQDLNRQQIYERLAEVAEEVGVDKKAFLDLLFIPTATKKEDFHNNGNKVTDDLKLQVKLGRQNGIHVSPTVVTNGIVDNGPSSGWTNEWTEYLQKL